MRRRRPSPQQARALLRVLRGAVRLPGVPRAIQSRDGSITATPRLTSRGHEVILVEWRVGDSKTAQWIIEPERIARNWQECGAFVRKALRQLANQATSPPEWDGRLLPETASQVRERVRGVGELLAPALADQIPALCERITRRIHDLQTAGEHAIIAGIAVVLGVDLVAEREG